MSDKNVSDTVSLQGRESSSIVANGSVVVPEQAVV